jgi:hypothetical protein
MKKSLPKLLGKTQKIFNAWIRNRDQSDGYFTCISCSKTLRVEKMNAGHYVAQKGGSFLRFNEWNVNGECAGCNAFDGSHIIGYRYNLLDKIGTEAVEFLEKNRNVVYKWSISELEEIIKKYTL